MTAAGLDLLAIVAVPLVAAVACRVRPRLAVPVTIAALLAAALSLAALPADHELGGGGLVLAVGGFGKGALWLSLLGVGMAVLADNPRPGADAALAWSAQLFAVLVVSSRSPVLTLTAILLLALLLPVVGGDAAPGIAWPRNLCAGAAVVTAGLAVAAAAHPPLTPHAGSVVLLAGYLLLVGAMPFGIGLRQWLIHSRARLALLVVACVIPALVSALVSSLAVLTALQRGTQAGVVLAAFGALTLLAGAVAQLGARDWRGLAADGAIADLGLVLVGVGGLDINGLQAASLALLVMALARPFLFLLEDMSMSGPWAWFGAGAALFSAAGLPPTVGFAARLLVLATAFHLHPVLAAAVVAGLVIEVFATARLLLRLGISLAGHERPGAVALVATTIMVLTVSAGVLPALFLAYAANLG